MPFEEDTEAEEEFIKSEVAYTEWKTRELRRLLRDREERKVFDEEQKEVERRRNLTDLQREEENARLGNDNNQKKDKVAYNFMQKYYHSGAFFQGDDSKLTEKQKELFTRDFNMPTGEDKMDKSVLPAVLQKRRDQWGKKGNTKYTHLTDMDTTNFDPSTKVG